MIFTFVWFVAKQHTFFDVLSILCYPFWENLPKRADKKISDILIKA